MADDQYLIPPPPKPESTQLAQHPQDKRRANIAIGIAALAVILTGIQAYEAHRARVDAKIAADAQSRDVERSRKAAEGSAIAASRGADAAWSSVDQLSAMVATGSAQMASSERMFAAEQMPSIGLDSFSYNKWLPDKNPRMDPSKPTSVKIALMNSGRPAFNCQIRSGGKFSSATHTFEDSSFLLFPGVIDLSTASNLSYDLSITPPASLNPASGEVRLYLYGNVNCAETLAPHKPYRVDWCMYLPISKTGDIVDFMHGCSEGVPASAK